MGKLLIIAILIFTACAVKGQDLKFGQIILVSSTPDTVPFGKVWKIEKIASASFAVNSAYINSCTADGQDNLKVLINGKPYFLNTNLVNGSSTSYQSSSGSSDGPMWIPAGTIIATKCAASVLSIIEFDVVP
ncbi:hypothetical protein UFOVP1596_37 [uncultured Caudovirales phage]|uniref:Uncharacterized protein n=1 Tax=uncultured Caudovirales phage TaxID=2100421 RepID=A0A6J5STC6_9CAUD|nr:hypothetical protein UFOVP1596_37 [uncultured Caudovirales phage]